jgi:hypothetical protein
LDSSKKKKIQNIRLEYFQSCLDCTFSLFFLLFLYHLDLIQGS